jgi:membrane protein
VVEVKLGARRLVRTARLALQAYLRAGCTQHAAAISYRVLFSLVPFLALLVAALEVAVPETTQERIVEWLLAEVPLPVDLRTGVETAVADLGTQAIAAGIVAFAVLVWGASGMMGSIRVAFRGVWDSEARRPYLRGKGRDVVLVLGAGLLVVSAFALSVVVQVVTEAGLEVAERFGRDASATAPLGTIAQVAAATGLTALAFLLLYRVAAPLEVRLRDALPAAILAGVAAQLASAGFSLYLRYFADFDDVYGPLSAVLALLLLVYVQATVLLAGACLAATWPQTRRLATSGSREG